MSLSILETGRLMGHAPTGLHPTAQGKHAKQTPPWVFASKMPPALNGQHPKPRLNAMLVRKLARQGGQETLSEFRRFLRRQHPTSGARVREE